MLPLGASAGVLLLLWAGVVSGSFTLEVVAPFTLRGVVPVSTAGFGEPYVTTRPTVGRVVQALPYKACTDLRNTKALRGNICLAERGDCPFVSISRNCAAAGCSGVIIADNSTQTSPQGLVGATSGQLPKTVMVSRETGQAILEEIRAGEDVVVKLGFDVRPVW